MTDQAGSVWRRWDPHLHTPETALNDQFGPNSWDDYVEALETADRPFAAIGATDYFTIRGYQRIREYQDQGRLPGLFVFPNIEMRLSMATANDTPLNIHLLVSPEDPDHVKKLEEKLVGLKFGLGSETYPCSVDGLRRLGRDWHTQSSRSKTATAGSVDDCGALRIGANQAKVDLTRLLEWRQQDPWLLDNTILVVPNGDDGVGGLGKQPGSSFALLRAQLGKQAHVIFSSSERAREYWLGRGTDDEAELRRRYGGPKPCLHGSDAHGLEQVRNPGDRLCWIKADPTWRGFLQILAEPDERVFVGAEPPTRAHVRTLRRVTLSGRTWCPEHPLVLNDGLITIVGPRGSGKTALADALAFATGSFDRGSASFLVNARKYAPGLEIDVTWSDGTKSSRAVHNVSELQPQDRDDEPETPMDGETCYLSQHFVESLCSPQGATDRLLRELERVVFEHLEPHERYGFATFSELRGEETSSIRSATIALEAEIRDLSFQIAEEYANELKLPEQEKSLRELDQAIRSTKAEIKRLGPTKLPKKQEELERLTEELGKLDEQLGVLETQRKSVAGLVTSIEQVESDLKAKSAALIRRAAGLPFLTKSEIDGLSLKLSGDPAAPLRARQQTLLSSIAALRGPTDPDAVVPEGTRRDLVAKIEAVKKVLGAAGQREKQFATLTKQLNDKSATRKTLGEAIEYVKKGKERIRLHQTRRLECFSDVLRRIDDEEQVLRRLYAPLEEGLKALDAVAKKQQLRFCVRRRIDAAAWVRKGQELFDFRKAHAITKRDALKQFAESTMSPVWDGTNVDANWLESFQNEFGGVQSLRDCLAKDKTLADFANWLFSTDHIRVEYAIQYDGVDLEELSPGTRGVVLLTLYLCLDEGDERPLIIDQPEENLDPKSVFSELVWFFRMARRRRQVVIVTHDANLVVNTDSELVVFADAKRAGEGPPQLRYSSGTLENPDAEREICDILEGGAEAFLRRGQRYAAGVRLAVSRV